MTVATKFVGGRNPWSVQDTRKLTARDPMPKRVKPPQLPSIQSQKAKKEITPMTKPSNASVDLSLLSICDDPIPEYRSHTEGKYDAFLASMKPGQAIKCPSGDIDRIANAIKKHVDKRHPNCIVRTMRNYGDGMGRVWMLPKPDSKQAK